MVEIIESSCISKHYDTSLNEDALTITDDVVAVFDGATYKGEQDFGSLSPGRCVARQLSNAAPSMGDPDDPDDPEIVVKYLHSVVADLGLDPVHAAASVAVLHIPSRRIVRVGDVTVGINGSFDAPVKEVDRIAAQARATLLMSLIQRGCDLDSLCRDDPGRQMILPLLRASSVWHNVEHECLGAGVIDGTHTPRSLIDVFDAPKGAEVILATDGYVNPCHSLEQSESELLKLIQRDPLRISEPPGTKGVLPGNQSFDDRTYIRLNL